MFLRVVKDLAGWSVIIAERLLNPAKCTDHVALVDHLTAAEAYEDILAVVRHADDFMWNDLPD